MGRNEPSLKRDGMSEKDWCENSTTMARHRQNIITKYKRYFRERIRYFIIVWLKN